MPSYSDFREHNKLGYFWASLRTPLGGYFDACLATRWFTSDGPRYRIGDRIIVLYIRDK